MSRDKRAVSRVVRKALRLSKMSPEQFARCYSGHFLWGASPRTVRRWADGESVPHPSVLASIKSYSEELEVK